MNTWNTLIVNNMANIKQISLLQHDLYISGLLNKIAKEYKDPVFLAKLSNEEVSEMHNFILDNEELEPVEIALGNLRMKYEGGGLCL